MALSGWVKLHRGLSDHHIASDPHSLSVWIHLLMLANHSETKRLINGRLVTVMPGQILTSRKSLSAKTGVQETKVERILRRMQNEQQIEQQGTTKFRVISILNWDHYQSSEQQIEQQTNSRRTADEQQVNTPEEVIPGGITQEGKERKEKTLKALAEKSAYCAAMFDRFWKLYPRKTAKQDARKAWAKLKVTDELFTLITDGLAGQVVCQAWTKDGGAFIPHPATWLNGRRWEDEVDDGRQDTRRSAGHVSLVDQVRERNRQREQERAGQAGTDDRFRTFDGEIVGADDEHVRPQMDLRTWP